VPNLEEKSIVTSKTNSISVIDISIDDWIAQKTIANFNKAEDYFAQTKHSVAIKNLTLKIAEIKNEILYLAKDHGSHRRCREKLKDGSCKNCCSIYVSPEVGDFYFALQLLPNEQIEKIRQSFKQELTNKCLLQDNNGCMLSDETRSLECLTYYCPSTRSDNFAYRSKSKERAIFHELEKVNDIFKMTYGLQPLRIETYIDL